MPPCPRCGRDHSPSEGLCPNLHIAPLPDPLIGTRLVDKYDLTGLVGIGGMGRVYEAYDPHLERQVAIKVLAEHLSRDEVLLSRFKREARASAATGHPNIVHVLDFGTTRDGRPFIVMELLRGHDLSEELRELQRLPVERAVDIAGQTLFGLSAAHEAGIVHRDLKPGNIFLAEKRVAAWHQVRQRSGESVGSFVKLLDFGLSRFTSGAAGDSGDLTKTGVALGTIYYMAPEQVRSPSTVDGRVDLYSVGVILYYCVTGKKPYQGDNAYNIINRILSEPPPDPRLDAPDLSPEFAALLKKAMAKSPEERFQTAEEFITFLRPFYHVESSEDGDDTTSEFVRPVARTAIREDHGNPFTMEDQATLVDQHPFGAHPELLIPAGCSLSNKKMQPHSALLDASSTRTQQRVHTSSPPPVRTDESSVDWIGPASEPAQHSKSDRLKKVALLVGALIVAFLTGLFASMLR